MKNESKLYGVVVGHENISFVVDGFQCVFINANMDTKKSEIITQNQGFVLGQTTERKYVYIFLGKDMKILHQRIFNLYLYFVSNKPDFETYKAISFTGGTLNKLMSAKDHKKCMKSLENTAFAVRPCYNVSA